MSSRERYQPPKSPARHGRNLKADQIRVTGQHIYWVYGLLIAKLRREVTWGEFAVMTGISPRHLRHMRFNEFVGSAKMAQRLLVLREQGLMIHLSDFLATPETEQQNLPLPHRRRKNGDGDGQSAGLPMH